MFHSGDGREGRGTITFFAEALSDTGVNEVSEVFCEPCLLRGIWLDDSELFRHLNKLVQIPAIQVVWVWCRGELSARSESGDGTRDVCR
jgi:hypothetical protein